MKLSPSQIWTRKPKCNICEYPERIVEIGIKQNEIFFFGPFVTLNEVYWKTIECNVQQAHIAFCFRCSSNWLKFEMSFWIIMKSEGNFIVYSVYTFFLEFFLLLLFFRLKIRHHQNICGQNSEQPWMKRLQIVVEIRDTYQILANNRKTIN